MLQATHELHEQLRRQQFELHRPNPRMLPPEIGVPQRLDVDCSLKTPQKVTHESFAPPRLRLAGRKTVTILSTPNNPSQELSETQEVPSCHHEPSVAARSIEDQASREDKTVACECQLLLLTHSESVINLASARGKESGKA